MPRPVYRLGSPGREDGRGRLLAAGAMAVPQPPSRVATGVPAEVRMGLEVSRMKHWKSSALAALMILLLCCGGTTGKQEIVDAAPATDLAAAEAIAAAGERLREAYLAQDLDRWLAGFTEDVVAMPPGARMIVGLDALREASRIQFGWLENYEIEIDGTPLETIVAGDWAYTRDGYEVRYKSLDGGEPFVDRGRSLAIWSRQPDGAWLVSRYMSNRPTDGPD